MFAAEGEFQSFIRRDEKARVLTDFNVWQARRR
jgi:hypothetical protein